MINVAIGIAGNSGSGKSTLARYLAESITENTLILECDRYHKWERGHAKWDSLTHLNPEANNLDQMSTDITKLINNQEISRVSYDHTDGKFTKKQQLKPQNFLIVSGLHALYYNNKDAYKLKIFMDTDEELQVSWKMNRDKKKRGYTYGQVVEQIEKRKEDYLRFILPQRDKADLSIKFTRNKDNKMSYSLFVEIDQKFNASRMCDNFASLGVCASLVGPDKKTLYFEDYKPMRNFDKYNNFYDYIIFLIGGIIDESY